MYVCILSGVVGCILKLYFIETKITTDADSPLNLLTDITNSGMRPSEYVLN
jgi:hypothetical protein